MSETQEFRLSAPVNLGQAIKQASEHLRLAGKTTPQLDARVIVCNCCSIEATHLIAHPEEEILPENITRLEEMIKRRAYHEPVAYITGKKEFWGRNFMVDRRVLIPRPDTETLIETTLPLLGSGMSVLDIGTGSGCIAITLALEATKRNRQVVLTGLDVSQDALDVAKHNAETLGASVEFILGDIRVHKRALGGRKFDLIVSNPPYVSSQELARLEPGVRDYEPELALHGGLDGLDTVRNILKAADNGLLAENGWILLEIGAGQAEAIRELTVGTNIRYHSKIQGLAGVDRVVLFNRQS